MFFIILLVGLSLDASFIRFCFLLVVLIRLFLFFVVASSSFSCSVGDVSLCCFVDFIVLDSYLVSALMSS